MYMKTTTKHTTYSTNTKDLDAEIFAMAIDGDANAQCALGYAYATAPEHLKDPEAAVHWYALAAEQNHLSALRSLANCYAQGFGVPQDLKMAYAINCKIITMLAGPTANTAGFDYPRL